MSSPGSASLSALAHALAQLRLDASPAHWPLPCGQLLDLVLSPFSSGPRQYFLPSWERSRAGGDTCCSCRNEIQTRILETWVQNPAF